MADSDAPATGEDTSSATDDTSADAAGRDGPGSDTQQTVDELGESGKQTLSKLRSDLKAANRELKDLRAKAAKVDELEAGTKSEQQRLTDELTEAKTRADTAEHGLIKFQVAAEVGLDLDWASRLEGEDRDELLEDAKKVKAMTTQKPQTTNQRRPDPNAGQAGSGKSSTAQQFAATFERLQRR